MERKVPKRRIEKIVISGNVIEYYRYLKPLNVEPREHDIEKNRETSEGKRDRNLYRARADLRRAIWCNQTKYTKFVTLTYKDTELDQDNVIYDYKQFIKKLRRREFIVPYVYVTEHQKKRGIKEGNAGSLHIHSLLFTDEFISADIINTCWGLDLKRFKHWRIVPAFQLRLWLFSKYKVGNEAAIIGLTPKQEVFQRHFTDIPGYFSHTFFKHTALHLCLFVCDLTECRMA